MEKFKSLDDLTRPDDRNLVYVVEDEKTGECWKLSINDVHQAIGDIRLNKSVPNTTQSQFNTAKNLAVYAWYAHALHAEAELKAIATVKFALRCVLGSNKKGLKRLLREAVDNKLISDSGFSHLEGVANLDPGEFSQKLPGILSDYKKNLRCGSPSLYPSSMKSLRICAEIINQLYPG